MNRITLNLSEHSYDIIVQRGALSLLSPYFLLDRKVLIVTDDGVPVEYANSVLRQCKEGHIVTIFQGEANKTFDSLQLILSKMCQEHFSRKDCVVAVGGGMIGDLAGFAASMYMRGVDFYNLPTTLLSQVDSSIGGKTAINFLDFKNMIGAFYQPKCVVIDPNLLSTLPKRQVANGMAEVIKMALTSDQNLFSQIEEFSVQESLLDELILKALLIKKSVVEQDEKESGLRKILNFGHTIGHGIENQFAQNGLYHGECVALGMLCMCSLDVRKRLIPVLKKWNLPTAYAGDKEAIFLAMMHDKKGNGNTVDIVTVRKIGECQVSSVNIQSLYPILSVLNAIELEATL